MKKSELKLLIKEEISKVLKENKKIFVQRLKGESDEDFLISAQKHIQQYIKDGSKDNLHLSHTLIQSLPNNLRVGGDLWAISTPIQSLPSNLTIKGDLNLSNTLIQSLPSDLKVGGNLVLYDTPIVKKYTKDQIKKMVPGVKGKIHTVHPFDNIGIK